MNPNLSESTSFTYKDLLLKKLYYSVVCSVLSQLVLLQVYIFISNFNLLHPLDWVWSTFNIFAKLSTWLFIFPFITIIFAQSIICAKDYVLKPSYSSTRFHKIIKLFCVHNLVLLALNVLIGATLIWLFLSLGGGQYQYITKQCKRQHYCLNEDTLFLIFSGFWTGLYYFVKVYISEVHLSFSVIHQRKLLQFKAQVLPLLKESFALSIWPTLNFVIVYYLWGNDINERFSHTFGFLREEDKDGVIIYLYLWIFGALYYFNMALLRFFFNLFLTEPVEFPLTKETADSLCLQDCINMSNLPIIQNLACLDLYNLTQWSKCRRQMFFTLSQPGGHPHNWNSLVENVLKLFNEYTEILSRSVENVEKTTKPPTSTPVQTPLQLQSLDRFRNFRNMSLAFDTRMLDIVDVTHTTLPSITIPETILQRLKEKINSALSVIKIVSGINFLFGELPQANVQKCLANGQIIIWTSQGISDLMCASILEDRFGVVQKDIPGIITTMVQLKQNLDKLNKVPALTRKTAGIDDFNFKMKGAVIMAVKRSLFNICKTFENYMSDFPLNKDVMLYLQTVYKS